MIRKTNYLAVIALALFITSCSAVKDLPQYHFADGFYRTSSLGAKNELVFVDNSEDTVLIYPTLREGSDYTPDIESGLVLVFPNQQVGSPVSRYRFHYPSFDFDLFTIPVIYRPSIDPVPHQLSSNLNGQVFLGYRLDRYTMSYDRDPMQFMQRTITHYGTSVGLFSGFGSTVMNPTVTNDRILQEYDGLIWSKGLATIIGIDSYSIGLAIGVDHLLDRHRKLWLFQGKPWVGLTLGLSIN